MPVKLLIDLKLVSACSFVKPRARRRENILKRLEHGQPHIQRAEELAERIMQLARNPLPLVPPAPS